MPTVMVAEWYCVYGEIHTNDSNKIKKVQVHIKLHFVRKINSEPINKMSHELTTSLGLIWYLV